MKERRPTKPRKRKFLRIDELEFFEIVLLMCGQPKQEHFDFQFNQWERGVGAWVRRTDEGMKFTELLMSYGEAKGRAGHFYSKYARWFRNERKKLSGQSTQPKTIAD